MGWFAKESPPEYYSDYDGLLLAFADPLWIYWEIVILIISIFGLWKFCGAGAKGMCLSLQSVFFPGVVIQTRINENDGRSLFQRMKLPQKWTLHISIASVIINSCILIIIYSNYIFEKPVPLCVTWILDVLVPLRETLIDRTTTLISAHMLCLHSVRHLWERCKLENRPLTSVHALYYLGKYMFVGAVPLTFISEAPGFGPGTTSMKFSFTPELNHALGVFSFAAVSYLQHSANKLFYELQENTHGNVDGIQNVIPLQGRGYQYVTCPRYLFEILIYLSLLLTMGFHHIGWCLACISVTVTYVIAAVLTHRHYRATYKDLPRRKAIIPYVL